MDLTDFLGNQYGPGDLVVYAAMSGRCVNMVFGRVVEIYRVYRGEGYDLVRVPVDAMGVEDLSELPKVRYGPHEGETVETFIKVKVQPLNSARWKQHSSKTYYTDSRTGRRINPKASAKYVAVPSHFETADGVTFDYAGQQQLWTQRYANTYGRTGLRSETFEYYFRRTYHVNYGPVGQHRFPLTPDVKDKPQLWWVSDQYHEWVEEHTEGPKPVTLEITDNIVRWMGVEPGAEVRLPVP